MRAIVFTIVACSLAGCMSTARVQEARCLSATLMDAWEEKNNLDSAEGAWRTAQRARFERSQISRESLSLSEWINTVYASSARVTPVSSYGANGLLQSTEVDEEQLLYQRMAEAHARYHEVSTWYGRVAHRVQTRFQEDDMLYPVLGMLATSTGIVLYPLVRWNVRSILWDGVDPDAEDDPVQKFCAARLGRDIPNQVLQRD